MKLQNDDPSEHLLRPTHAALRAFTGGVEPAGLELARLVGMVARLYETIADSHLQEAEVSGPRLRLLLRLRGEELQGNLEGCSPTHLSQCQYVSKNTISALLRGLEEQGLVQRSLDPADRRAFRIRLSEAGRRLTAAITPAHMRYMNELASGLTGEEQAQLAGLLAKLYRSLAEHAHKVDAPPDTQL